MYQVLEMFENKKIIGIKFDMLYVSLSDMMLEVLLVLISLLLLVKLLDSDIINSNSIVESANEIVKDLIKSVGEEQIGSNRNYVTMYLLGMFVLLLFLNLYGFIPLSYSLTSQLSLTVFMSFSVCFGVTIIGFLNMGFNYLYLFITQEGEMPSIIVPFLVTIEFLSYGARYFSLGLRLFANMMAGHSLMVILSKFFLIFSTVFLMFSI